MDINTWFENGCNYQEGVTLYATVKGRSSNLLRLFLRKESIPNLEKLKYELGKHRQAAKKEASPETKSVLKRKLTIKIEGSQKGPEPKPASSYFYRLNQLHPDLHTLAIEQRTNFQTAIALHLQMTKLHPNEEGAALSLCIEIEDLFDAIETTQKVLDHYVTHKVVLDTASRGFKDLTPAQLIQTRNNKRISVSKYTKKVDVLNNKLRQNLSKAEKTKTEVALQKS